MGAKRAVQVSGSGQFGSKTVQDWGGSSLTVLLLRISVCGCLFLPVFAPSLFVRLSLPPASRSEFVSLGTVYVSFQALPSHLPSSPHPVSPALCMSPCVRSSPPCVCVPPCFSLCVPPFLSCSRFASPRPCRSVSRAHALSASALVNSPGSPAPTSVPVPFSAPQSPALKTGPTPPPPTSRTPRGVATARGPRSGEFGPGSRRKGSELGPAVLRWGRASGKRPSSPRPPGANSPWPRLPSGRIKVAALPLHRSVTSALPLSVGSTSFGHLRRHGSRRHLQGEPPNRSAPRRPQHLTPFSNQGFLGPQTNSCPGPALPAPVSLLKLELLSASHRPGVPASRIRSV